MTNFELLSNLQGNILKGHGREHTTHVFIRFDGSKVAKAKKWIRDFASAHLVSAQKQFKQREVYRTNKIPGGLFAGFYLSASGYTALGFPPPPDPSFNEGMKSDVTKLKLQDPPVTKWERGYKDVIHAMVLLAHDDVDEMGKRAQMIIEDVDRNFARILHVEYGRAIRNENGDGIEHFGYADGVSQPLFLQDEIDAFKNGKTSDEMKWDPEAPLELVLVPDTLANDPAAKGSYFVFRKLEQQVKAFKIAEQKLADNLGLSEGDSQRAGAMIVGRFEDGTPLTMNNKDGVIGSGSENNFNYDNDTAGAKCPFHAHIRKANPRGTGLHEPLEEEKSHMIVRRGITYGLRNVNTHISPSIAQSPEDGVGLLFMCFQANIANQFEFIQANWVNNPNFPSSGDGSDPILGQGLTSTGRFAAAYNDPATLQTHSFNSFVTMKGGEYFFAPSLKFLKSL
ncbi:MAG TPA: Dyp-type peroxidase [Chitinophagales bacterium]|nr:Dyp-type peroxidase [Chitinophagales bacterium]